MCRDSIIYLLRNNTNKDYYVEPVSILLENKKIEF